MSSRKDHRQFNNRRKFGERFSGASRRFTQESSYSTNKQDKYGQFMQQKRLSEVEVGITEYLGNLDGFSGIIKARYSDFHVNEINNSQETAKLTDITVPNDFVVDAESDEESPTKHLDLIPQETWNELEKMLNTTKGDCVKIDVTSITKEERTKIHENVKEVFGQKIIASTVMIEDKKFIEFKKYTKEGDRRDNRQKWPQSKGEYVYFLVYKEAMDTLEATFRISDRLRIKSSAFAYAGVKDRRAKTTQWFCVKKVHPGKLLERTKYLRNIHIGNMSFHNEPLKLGQLYGNRFRIALRNVTAEDSLINQAMESLKSKGFINYYGLQRFGNDKDVPTFDVGIKLLQGKWKEACNLILQPKPSDDPASDITHAKRVYKETSNCSLASKEFNRSHNKCVESKLLLGLVKNNDNDYVNALENIPRNMRLLYIHAFQSLVWNKMVSQRIKEFGLKPVPGDLVLLAEQPEPVLEDDDENGEEVSSNSSNNHQEVKILRQEDLNDYSIYDVVLPLPGYDIKYPENEVKTWYENMLKEHGLTLEMPKQRVKTYTLSGAYRKILGRASNLSWKTMKYNHPNDTLIRSDHEELTGQEEPTDNPDGQYKALIVDFCLNSSCYATMVLREILKMDTCLSVQAQLNNYHQPNVTEDNSKFAEADSLLSDTAKYEEFKQQIFGMGDDVLKRKSCDECEESVSKKLKSDADNEAGIKIQPSLV